MQNMFEKLVGQLKKIETQGISVPIKMDEEGYFDRECPNEPCLFQFKILKEDWTNLCKDEAIYCPFCGHQAPSKSWWTKEQLEGAKNQAMGQIKAVLSKGLSDGARDFNQRQQRGLITMSMKVSGGPQFHSIVPVGAQEAMELKIQCETCATRFAVIGSAFFCPCCGHNSVERTFDDSMRKVEVKLDNLETIRSALETQVDRDTAELTCRSLVETCINDCVVAFQKIMQFLHSQFPAHTKPSFSAFQKLDEGSKLWRQVCNKGYEDWLSQAEMDETTILFQKRHLLAHTEGFVDEKYLQRSRDTSYKVGQRIVVREQEVRRLLHLTRSLVSSARSQVAAKDAI
jgi:uncharacterized Zn finger protein (UPF0148 family)